LRLKSTGREQSVVPQFEIWKRKTGVTPAMAAGITDRVMHMADAVALIDAKAALMPSVRGPYKKRASEIEISN
jgi:hypothetical protein